MKHVVVFGVDGVRIDALRAAHTPRIDAIAHAGFLAEFEVSAAAPTVSAPGWATVATGVRPNLHGVYSNILTGHRLAVFPDFLTRLRRAGRRTFVAASWGPLATTEQGGPLFGPPTRLSFVDGEQVGYRTADQLLADDVAAVLSRDDMDGSFVYLGEPDYTAHRLGTGADYVAAIEATDRRIGQVLDAIATRPTYADEEWTIIVVTDHGHRDGGGHGQRTRWERSAWIAACGPGIPNGHVPVCHVDVAPQVLAAAGVPMWPEHGFAGVPFSSRVAPAPAIGPR